MNMKIKIPILLSISSTVTASFNYVESSQTIRQTAQLEDFIGKSINSTCSVTKDTLLLQCSASTDVLVAGVFNTDLVQGACSAINQPTQINSTASIALNVTADCKNSGACNNTHCFRANFVVQDVPVLAAMSQVASVITYDKDGSFTVAVDTSAFTANDATTNTTVAPNVTATLGECGSTSNTAEALDIGDTAVICISSDANVLLSLKSVTATPGDQVLVNNLGDPNFLTTFNNNANPVTLSTLMITGYYDAQGGDAGSILIQGTAQIAYTSRRLQGGRFLEDVEEAPFGLQVPLVRRVSAPEVAQISAEEGNVGKTLGWSGFNPLVFGTAAVALF